MWGATIQFWFENCYLVLVWGQLSNHIYLQGLWIGAIGSGVREEEGKRGKRKRRKKRKRKRKRMTKLFWVQSFCYRDAEPNAFSQKKVETKNAPKPSNTEKTHKTTFRFWFFFIGWFGFFVLGGWALGSKPWRLTRNQVCAALGSPSMPSLIGEQWWRL